jgi:hypothetical protein
MENNALSGVVHRFLPEKGANCLSMLQRAFDRYWNGADGRDGYLRIRTGAPGNHDSSAVRFMLSLRLGALDSIARARCRGPHRSSPNGYLIKAPKLHHQAAGHRQKRAALLAAD